MSKRGGFGSMADRLASTRAAAARESAGANAPAEEAKPAPPTDVRHVWVTTQEGRVAGLLIQWRQTRGEWSGRCVFPQGRAMVEEWVAAAHLEPVTTG